MEGINAGRCSASIHTGTYVFSFTEVLARRPENSACGKEQSTIMRAHFHPLLFTPRADRAPRTTRYGSQYSLPCCRVILSTNLMPVCSDGSIRGMSSAENAYITAEAASIIVERRWQTKTFLLDFDSAEATAGTTKSLVSLPGQPSRQLPTRRLAG